MRKDVRNSFGLWCISSFIVGYGGGVRTLLRIHLKSQDEER